MTRGLQLSTAEIPISHENIYFKNHNIQISTMTGDSSNPDGYHAKLVNSECVPKVHRATRVIPLLPIEFPPERNPKNPATRNPALGTFFGTSREVKALS